MSNSFASVHPELVCEWSEKNLPLTPDKITFGSNKIMWWKGSCGHEWQASVKSRSIGEKCPICSGARAVEGINDLVTLKPELAAEWSSKNMEHITDLRKQDITGERFGRLTAVRPTEQRDNNGSVIWELRCDCGNLTYKTVNALKSGRVLSCGCKYRETRSETVKHRRDMVEGTNVSNIVVSKHLRSNNTSGHTGVGLDRRTGKWYAYINFQKKHYNLGLHKDKSAAIRARRAAEARLHDPVILEYWDSLTEKRKKEFQDYLRSTNK